jgi:ferredoxin
MNKRKYKKWFVYALCAALIFLAFFSAELVFYDFEIEPANYSYSEIEQEQPLQADAFIWFSYGDGKELFFNYTDNISIDDIRFYALTEEDAVQITAEDMRPIRDDFLGYFIAAQPVQNRDVDGDGTLETVYNFARTDMGIRWALEYGLFPRAFNSEDIPFEVVFADRRRVEVHYWHKPLANQKVMVISADGRSRTYYTNERGWIPGLNLADIRKGITVSYSPGGSEIYRMYYRVESYPFFSHLLTTVTPLLRVLSLSVVAIIICLLIRRQIEKKNPAYAIFSREKPSVIQGSPLNDKTNSKFMTVRWLSLAATMFLWMYGGRIFGAQQALNDVGIPLLSCPYNQDIILENGCYYLSHITNLPLRGIAYTIVFIATMLICMVFLGKILCGFLCPLGFIQDIFDKIRRALKIRPITVNERLFKLLQPIKWVWIILFVGLIFVGVDYCNICPNRAFAPALAGTRVNLYLGGFISVIILAGSFFIRRFWCIICPMGYIIGILHKFNIFKLKKDCTACTECGACYEACPMRIKTIYTEREESDVQTVDCLMCGECIHKCPENDALAMTLCGKPIYKSSRESFMSRYANMNQEKEKSGAARKNGGVGNDG